MNMSVESMYDFSILRELRQREKLTLREVADRSGVCAPVISKIERNQSQAELNTLHRLARVFEMSAAELLDLAEHRGSQTCDEEQHTMAGFSFRQVAYGNVKALYGQAAAGSSITRPEVHKDDYEMCWVLAGEVLIQLPTEQRCVQAGQAIQFDAILQHTYTMLQDTRMMILHLHKSKRF